VVKPFVESLGFEVGRELGLVNNPEFLREGHALDDFMNPDRIVIGENDRRAGEVLEEIYQPFSAPILHVSWNTGEFIKYLSNALLSTLISFSNEMSQIADAIGGIEIAQAFRILHQDRRWSGQPANMSTYVYPGCGFGGYCLPKDTRALCAQAEAKGYTPALMEEVLRTNSRIKQFVAGKVLQAATDGDYVGVLGLSFKPESDDVRSSPAEDIVRILLEKGHKKIIAYDPLGMENFRSAYALPIEYAASVEEVVKRARLLVILTAWREFVDKREFLATRRVLDFRYVLS
jgi:UDPglucose 6-dehydrogenase